MTKRPALGALIGAMDVPPGEAMNLIVDYRAEVAHELAEKQRAWAREPEKLLRANVPEQLATVIAAVPIVDAAADLIDPEVSNDGV